MPVEQLTPKQLVYKHIFDRSHVVTNDEFDKIKVGIAAEDERKINEEIAEKKGELSTLHQSHHLPDPYNILSE